MKNITVRASGFSTLFDCAHRWEGEHLLGMRADSSNAANLGTAVHAGTAAFDESKRDVSSFEEKIEFAKTKIFDSIEESVKNGTWDAEETPVDEALKTANSLTEIYARDISPKFDFELIEAKSSELSIDFTDLRITFTGSLDRLRVGTNDSATGEKQMVVADIKTGKTAVSSDGSVPFKAHIAQTGIYSLLAEHALGYDVQGAQIIGLKTTKKHVVGVSEIFDARSVLVGANDEIGLIEHGANILKSGSFPPNNKSMLCSEKYCGRWKTCKFRG